jgi:hypothetical protein
MPLCHTKAVDCVQGGTGQTRYGCDPTALSQHTDRQIASLTAQCRQVYCLVEMALSAPSLRPQRNGPLERGEFDGFPGRRERPNQCRHTTIVSGLFNTPNPQKKSQKKNSTIRSIPNPAKRIVPSSVSRKPYSSTTFTNLNNSLNREPKE